MDDLCLGSGALLLAATSHVRAGPARALPKVFRIECESGSGQAVQLLQVAGRSGANRNGEFRADHLDRTGHADRGGNLFALGGASAESHGAKAEVRADGGQRRGGGLREPETVEGVTGVPESAQSVQEDAHDRGHGKSDDCCVYLRPSVLHGAEDRVLVLRAVQGREFVP